MIAGPTGGQESYHRYGQQNTIAVSHIMHLFYLILSLHQELNSTHLSAVLTLRHIAIMK